MKTTLLIYMASDNDLAHYAEQDLEKIIETSYYSEMTIVVQYVANFVGTPPSMRVVVENGEIKAKRDLGQLNSATPTTLNNFIEESATEYPADKFIVILWSHGSGIDDRDIYDVTKERKLYFVSKEEIEEIAFGFDDSFKDFLDNIELKKALDVSVKIDVLGFDACFMGMFEIAYQLRNQTEIMVASQHLEPALGWDYTRILEDLDMSKASTDIGKQFIAFHDEHHIHNEKAIVTQSALDTSVIDEVSKKLDKFAEVLREELKKDDVLNNRKELEITLRESQNFERNDYLDLINLVQNIQNRLEFKVLEPYTHELIDSLNNLIIANHSLSDFMKKSNGVSIYFPYQNRPCEETFGKYEALDFSQNYPNWIKLLKWYWL